MGEEILITKGKKRDRIEFKVRNRSNKKFSPDNYMKIIDPKNPHDFAVLMEDLNLLYNTPVEKSFFIYKSRKGKMFPF